jgi:TatD DNase family protein
LAVKKMNFPEKEDYINIHTHGGKSSPGIFIVENLMAHERVVPHDLPATAFSLGIHPWFLDEGNSGELLDFVRDNAANSSVIALGEAGFDKLRGPSPELQNRVFSEQVKIAGSVSKPVFIHCVKAWDELLAAQKKIKPKTNLIIHGFRGNRELAAQLLSKGFYLSFWFDFIIRPESKELIRSIPQERIFLETDGADIDIKQIYEKVAGDLGVPVDELKKIILDNYNTVFK